MIGPREPNRERRKAAAASRATERDGTANRPVDGAWREQGEDETENRGEGKTGSRERRARARAGPRTGARATERRGGEARTRAPRARGGERGQERQGCGAESEDKSAKSAERRARAPRARGGAKDTGRGRGGGVADNQVGSERAGRRSGEASSEDAPPVLHPPPRQGELLRA